MHLSLKKALRRNLQNRTTGESRQKHRVEDLEKEMFRREEVES